MAKRATQLAVAIGAGTVALVAMVALLVGPVRPALARGLLAPPNCTVPEDSATIQGAVDNPACITISVAAGMYAENVVITRSLTLQGAGAASTTVDGGRAGVVISITNGAAPTIEGFTITGGDGSTNNGKGGGIFVSEATAIIRDNVISDNVASQVITIPGDGGGIFVISSTSPVLIHNNIIQANLAYSAALTSPAVANYGAGGGIEISDASSAVITHNQIISNVAARTDVPSPAASGYGGGISAYCDWLIVEDNTIRGNLGIATGLRGFGGGIISFLTPVVTITDNIIVGNTVIISGSGAQGGGIYLGTYSGSGHRFTLAGNWVMSNTAGVTITPNAAFGEPSPYVGGGGLRIWGGMVDNDIFILENNHLLYNVGAVYVTDLNGGSVEGGGLSVSEISTTLIISNEISYNTAALRAATAGSGGWGGGVFGGGIDFWGSEDITVQDSHIENNVAVKELSADGVHTTGAGGGLGLGNFQTAVLTNNWLVGNVAVISASITSATGENFSAAGGGIQVDGWERPNDSLTIQNNHLIDNLAVQTMTTSGADSRGHPEGGGLLVRNVTTTLILSNEVQGNTAVETLFLIGSGGWGGRPAGGGMFVGESDSLTLGDNRIEDNVAAWRQAVTGVDSNSEGGGIAVVNVLSTTLSSNTVSGNTAVVSGSITSDVGGHYSPQGGGIRIGCGDRPGCSLSFSGNDILSNTTVYTLTVGGSNASGGAQGGGLVLDDVANVALNGDRINDNQALVSASTSGNNGVYANGGGIKSWNSNLTLSGCTLNDNWALVSGGHGADGGGLAVDNNNEVSNPTVALTDNWIEGNVALGSGSREGHGGGVRIRGVVTATLTGNTIISNVAAVSVTVSGGGNQGGGVGGGMNIGGNEHYTPTVVISDNVIAHNTAAITVTAGNGASGKGHSGGVGLHDVMAATVISNEVRENTGVYYMALSGDDSGTWGGAPLGGGMSVHDVDTLTIQDNQVLYNVAAQQQVVSRIDSSSQGGGIALFNPGTATISDNIISGNTAVVTGSFTSDAGGGYFPSGGGIMIDCGDKPSCDLSVVGNEISSNTAAYTVTVSGTNANGGATGGGIEVARNVLANLQNNTVSDNVAHQAGRPGADAAGGGMDVNAGTVTMSQNRFLGNQSSLTGWGAPGAVWVWEGSLTSINDVFARNVGGVGAGAGGFSRPTSEVTIINDTFYDNGRVGVEANMTSTVYVTNTIVYSHDQGLSLNDLGSVLIEDYNLLSNTNNYAGAVITGLNTIIGQDPRFVNAAIDDFHLDGDAPSPAIDKGTSSGAPSVDFEGDTRPQGDGVDMGADEATGAGPVYLPIILKKA